MLIIAAILVCSATVPLQPPNSAPDWFSHDSSYVLPNRGPLKRVVSVVFKASAPQADRQAAVAKVDGCVIGGVRVDNDGFYYIYVPTATTYRQLEALVTTLERMPAVHHASLVVRGTLNSQ